ncbi:MAG: hypothetical protein SPL80_07595 [Bacilli bacterium]|nr:hypothetical protein [Bacilli bacterium]
MIILLVWVMELCFVNNKKANAMGIGVNTGFIALIPFLLFYHPHKGPRNRLLDYTTIIVYAIAISYAYFIAIFYVIASGVWVGLLC